MIPAWEKPPLTARVCSATRSLPDFEAMPSEVCNNHQWRFRDSLTPHSPLSPSGRVPGKKVEPTTIWSVSLWAGSDGARRFAGMENVEYGRGHSFRIARLRASWRESAFTRPG
jgi:hypothetical protein